MLYCLLPQLFFRHNGRTEPGGGRGTGGQARRRYRPLILYNEGDYIYFRASDIVYETSHCCTHRRMQINTNSGMSTKKFKN